MCVYSTVQYCSGGEESDRLPSWWAMASSGAMTSVRHGTVRLDNEVIMVVILNGKLARVEPVLASTPPVLGQPGLAAPKTET